MSMIGSVLISMAICLQVAADRSSSASKDYSVNISDLLKLVIHVKINNRPARPSSEALRNVKFKLGQIAKQDSKERAEVIEALIRVLKDPEARRENGIADGWIMAVDLLG